MEAIDGGGPEDTGMATAMDIAGDFITDTGEDTMLAGAQDTGQAIVPEGEIALICTEIVLPVYGLRDPQGIPQPGVINPERNRAHQVDLITCIVTKVGMCTVNKTMEMYSSGQTVNGKIPAKGPDQAR